MFIKNYCLESMGYKVFIKIYKLSCVYTHQNEEKCEKIEIGNILA